MKIDLLRISRWLFIHLLLAVVVFVAPATFAQGNPSASGKDFYNQIKSFKLSVGSATVSALTFDRDRAKMSFTGRGRSLDYYTTNEATDKGSIFGV
jgi:hypothetical protein